MCRWARRTTPVRRCRLRCRRRSSVQRRFHAGAEDRRLHPARAAHTPAPRCRDREHQLAPGEQDVSPNLHDALLHVLDVSPGAAHHRKGVTPSGSSRRSRVRVPRARPRAPAARVRELAGGCPHVRRTSPVAQETSRGSTPVSRLALLRVRAAPSRDRPLSVLVEVRSCLRHRPCRWSSLRVRVRVLPVLVRPRECRTCRGVYTTTRHAVTCASHSPFRRFRSAVA